MAVSTRSGEKRRREEDHHVHEKRPRQVAAEGCCANAEGCTKNLSHTNQNARCDRAFYDCSCEDLAKALLGCMLVRLKEGQETCGKIVETEAYLGLADKAAHSYRGRKTERNTAMFMEPGTSYVYSIYGMHKCFNISSRGEGCAVLLRALEPVGGLELMRERRHVVAGKPKDHHLCNGPAKLCQALSIGKECDKVDLVNSEELWVEPGDGIGEEKVHCGPRIGIDYAEEWAEKPLRFYIQGNQCISKK